MADVQAGPDARGARDLDAPADAHEEVQELVDDAERHAHERRLPKRPASEPIDEHRVEARSAQRMQRAVRRAALQRRAHAREIGAQVLHERHVIEAVRPLP